MRFQGNARSDTTFGGVIQMIKNGTDFLRGHTHCHFSFCFAFMPAFAASASLARIDMAAGDGFSYADLV